MLQLRTVRESTGKGLNQTAREIGVSQAQLSQWETGKTQPTVRNLQRLAAFYGVALEALIGHTEAAS
jgi:transcriptional regulator with XRE-family HTH domain